MSGMTKGERADLLSLVKKREKVMRAQAQERSAALLAEFDISSAKIYHWDDDAIWAKAKEQAEAAILKARDEIANRAREMGIPEEFMPDLHMVWMGRGHNAVSECRAELRRAAKSKIEAMEKEALSRIERFSLEAQTKLVASGLDSEGAKDFLENMPKMETLMPSVEITEIQSLLETRKAQRRLSLDYNYN